MFTRVMAVKYYIYNIYISDRNWLQFTLLLFCSTPKLTTNISMPLSLFWWTRLPRCHLSKLMIRSFLFEFCLFWATPQQLPLQLDSKSPCQPTIRAEYAMFGERKWRQHTSLYSSLGLCNSIRLTVPFPAKLQPTAD